MRLSTALVSFSVALAASAGVARAEDFPIRPVRIIVPYSPGGLADIAVRIIAQKFSDEWQQPVLTINAPGGGGIVAMNQVLEAPADGYTISYTDGGMWAINSALKSKLPYDPERDFTPIGMFGQTFGMFIAVNSKSGINSLQQLIEMARAKPGSLSYGSPGVSSIHFMMMEDFKADAGLDILHVPYKSNAETVPALLSGDITLSVTALTAVQSYVESGEIKLLAVGKKVRSKPEPDVPTIAEIIHVPDFDHPGGEGIQVKTGTPPDVVEKIRATLAKVAGQPDLRKRFNAVGLEVAPDVSPDYLAKVIRSDRERFTQLARTIGLRE